MVYSAADSRAEEVVDDQVMDVYQGFSQGQKVLRFIDLYSFQVGSYYTNFEVGGSTNNLRQMICTKTTTNDRKSVLLRMAVNYLPASQNRCVPWLQLWRCFCPREQRLDSFFHVLGPSDHSLFQNRH